MMGSPFTPEQEARIRAIMREEQAETSRRSAQRLLETAAEGAPGHAGTLISPSMIRQLADAGWQVDVRFHPKKRRDDRSRGGR